MIDIYPITARRGNGLSVFEPGYVPWFAAQPGEWRGDGAGLLGLGRLVHRDTFIRLLEGVSPDGSVSLLENALDPNRFGGWHIRVAAPESVQILWNHSGWRHQRAIEGSHVAGCSQLITELTSSITANTGGSELDTMRTVVAAFDHFGWLKGTRLQTDFVLFNIGLKLDGPNQELNHSAISNQRPRLEGLYETTLRRSLEGRLGLAFTQESPLRIQGVPTNEVAAQAKTQLEARLNPQSSFLVGLGKEGSTQNSLWNRREASSLIASCLAKKEIARRVRILEWHKARRAEAARPSMPRKRVKRPKTLNRPKVKAQSKSRSQSLSHSH